MAKIVGAQNVRFCRAQRSDYNRGWDCFIAGHNPPINPSRPFIDGFNKARRSALAFNGCINEERALKVKHGLLAAYKERIVEADKLSYTNEKSSHMSEGRRDAMDNILYRFKRGAHPLSELLADREEDND